MGRIASYDVWQTYEHETMTDEDLLDFTKGLFREGFIKVSTVYDEELDKNVTRYDITAIKEVKEKKEEPKKEEPDVKKLDTTDSKQQSFLGRLFNKDEKKID